MTRSVLVAGAGGVGKTTLAAAFAVAAARNGRETLVLTVDPARRLADAMEVTIGNEPTMTPQRGLAAAMLDASESWHGVVTRHATPAIAERLLASPYYRAIAERFPAGQAYAVAEQMAEYVESGSWELVVVDTPPSGGGLDFFTAPSVMRHLVGGRVLRWLTGSFLPGRRRLYQLTARPALRLAGTLLGGPLLEDIAEFLLDLRTIYDGVARRARTLERHLGRATCVVVTTADAAPLAEAGRFFGELPDVVARPSTVIFNRALPQEWIGAANHGFGIALAENLFNWSTEAQHQSTVTKEFARRNAIALVRVPWRPHPPTGLDDLEALINSAEGFDPERIGIS